MGEDSEECDIIKNELKKVKEAIAEVEAHENYMFVKKNVEHLVNDTDNLNPVRMWEIKKKLCSKKAPYSKEK